MPVITDPAFLLLYGLDESGPTAIRANSGSLGDDHELTPWQASGTDGIPSVDDGNGGKAAYLDAAYPSPYNTFTTAQRALRGPTSLGSAHTAKPALPIASASDDFAFGARVKWVGGETDGGGANEMLMVFGLSVSAGNLVQWGIGVQPQGAGNPQTDGKIRIALAGTFFTVGGAGYTEGGAPAAQYFLPDRWWRILVRVFFSATGYKFKVYAYDETAGVTYTFENNSVFATDYQASFNSSPDARIFVGIDSGASNPISFYGQIDNCWLYDSPMSDTDAGNFLNSGFTIPWNEPTYRVADHDVRVTWGNEAAIFPKPRQLPVGGLAAEHPVQVNCERFRVKYQGFRPGRPHSIRRMDAMFDTIGRQSSRSGHTHKYDNLSLGLMRIPGALPSGALVDVRDMEFSGTGARRRRGFRVRRNVSTSFEYAANAFGSWRDSADSLFMFYKVGDKLYAETGSGATQIDSGWNQTQLPVFAALDNRMIIVSAGRRKSWRGSGSAVESFGVATPAAPTAIAAAGTLTGTFYYAYTEYDPTTGDESGPAILVTPITLAAEGATLTLAAVSSDTRFSQRRIYRTVANGAPPDLFLIATITSATSHTDSGATDGTVPVGRVLMSDDTLVGYFTGAAPQDFVGCVSHLGRMFYWYANKLYWTPEGEPMRWFATDFITADGPITAAVSRAGRLILYTRKTVELIESDFVRDGTGVPQIRRSVLTFNVGCPGPHAVCEAGFEDVFWIDRRGVYTLNGDRVEKVSHVIDNLFPYINSGYSRYISSGYNHIRNQVWFACPFANIQDDNTRSQTIIVMHLGSTPYKWSLYRMEASFVGQFDDDLNGVRFGLIDHLGVFKECESFEGDGAEGNESFTTEDDDGIQSISGSVITVSGTPGWTSGALRGFGVVLRDVSTGAIYYYTISTNGTNTLTIVGTPNANLAALDGYYIGGMLGEMEIAEQDFGSSQTKHVTQMKHEFDDLTAGRFV